MMPLVAVGRSTKRVLDLALGGVGLLATAPVALVAAVAVALDDGAPVLFRQERVGLHREPFTVIKLRTMRDGRTTRVGGWLRSWGLDELPQLLNVLRGDMSLVGPRPLTPSDVRRLGWDHPRFGPRFEVAPGLTGPVQVLGAVSAKSSAAIERAYVGRGGVETDLAILGATALMFVAGRDGVQRLLRRALGSRLEAWTADDSRADPVPCAAS
jgi:lipopolysaccharide/colanic/teichoic acid biosynthesis glycosyltransferase